MSKTTSGVILVIILLAGVAAWLLLSTPPKPPPATLPTTGPASLPSTKPATAPVKVIRNLVDVVLESDPQFPSTQPLTIPGDIADGARLVITQPVYLDSRRDLWVTHPQADAISEVLARAKDEQLHLTTENVRFVHYWVDANEKPQTALVVENTSGAFEYLTSKSRHELKFEDPPAFASAISWQDRIVVPTAHGIAIVTADHVTYQKIAETGGRTLLAVDPQGLLAWAPPRDGKPGSNGAFRYIDGKWASLDPSNGWPSKILHLIPLLDGSVLVLKIEEDGNAGVSLQTLVQSQENPTPQNAAAIDESKIKQLVSTLSDKDSVVREQAFAELARYGPGAFAILDKLKPSQPAGARLRIEDLLSARLQQTLGTLRLEAGPLDLVSRFDDGGAIYFSEAGVTVFSENVGPQLITPAYIVVRPGRAVRLLPEMLVRDYAKNTQKLIAFADEWFITDEITGPQRFVGNHFQKILRKREREFWIFKGIDARGRWMFTNNEGAATLILDPTLPSPTPKLPVWEYPVRKGEVGWTSDNWPAVKRPGAWVLMETSWRPLDEAKEKFITESPADDSPMTSPTTEPTSQPSTQPATLPTSLPSAPQILSEKDGTRWFDGADHLIAVHHDGSKIDWELPGVAVGSGKVRLFRIDDKRLLLFNQTGRIISLRQTRRGKEPFTIDAVFTDKIPDTDAAKRIWQDPAGRVLIEIEDTLWILFPSGKVPEALENMMPPGSMSAED